MLFGFALGELALGEIPEAFSIGAEVSIIEIAA